MGLDDRDYMRDRYRQRQSAGNGGVRWNDKKVRVEHDPPGYKKAVPKPEVPLGSASWIGKDRFAGGSGGGWFEAKNRGHDYQRGRYRRRPVKSRQWVRSLRLAIPVLCLLTYAIPMFGDAKRGGWLPDFRSSIPFPESGSVEVAKNLSMKRVTSHLTVQTSDANAVVQLFDPDTDDHVLSVYVAGNDRVEVPAPRGTYRMRIVEGRKWHGPKEFFGPNTQFETVIKLLTFPKYGGHGIDLRRRPDGNLHTRPMITNPEPLQ